MREMKKQNEKMWKMILLSFDSKNF